MKNRIYIEWEDGQWANWDDVPEDLVEELRDLYLDELPYQDGQRAEEDIVYPWHIE